MLDKLRKGKISGFLAPETRSGWAIVESMILTLSAIGVGFFFNDSDPLGMQGQFRWFLIVPVLVALRYGSLLGGFAMLSLLGSWFALRNMGFYNEMQFPEGLMLGGLILALVCGEFADMWRVRLLRANSTASYALERLQNLTQRYVLLRLSHDRLEENLLIKPYTVRDALVKLRNLTLDESRGDSLPAADDLINLLAEYCQLQRAAIYPVIEEAVLNQPAAMLGETKPLEHDNELVAHAMENQMLAHVQHHDNDEHYHGLYLVAAPITNSAGNIIGIVVVERLPFLSMNQENLQLLSVLLNFYADVVYNGDAVTALQNRWPMMPFRMASEMTALSRLQRDARVETALTVFVADESEQAGLILDALARGLRSLDLAWWINDRALLIMMPMTGESSLEGFVLRTEKWLQDDYAFMSLRQAGVQFYYRFLNERDMEEQVARLLEVSDV